MNDLKQISDEIIDWDYIHRNCSLDGARNSLFLFSRWFSRRFENVIFLMEEGYYFESLFNLITLIENYLNSRANENWKFRDIIDKNVSDEIDNRILHELRKLRNYMAHSRLIEYYIVFEQDEKHIEYPLNEYVNFGHILNRVFVFCASFFDSNCCKNKLELITGIVAKRYTLSEIAFQYGLSEDNLEKIKNSMFKNDDETIDKDTSKNIDLSPCDDENLSDKEIEYTILRLLDNSTPVAIWQGLFSNLIEPAVSEDSKNESDN